MNDRPREDYEKGGFADFRREQARANGHKFDTRRRSKAFNGFVSAVEFLDRMRPPDYLAAGLLLRGSTYTLTGNTGHCKTLIALLLAIKVAQGDWFCGRLCKRGTVLFFAGENPDNVRVQFYGMCEDLAIDPTELDIAFHEGVCDIAKEREKIWWRMSDYPDLALTVFDSLQAHFMGDDDSANMPMLNLAIDFRSLIEHHPNRPTGLILAHPVKNAQRDQLLPRGGSAITNELDGNLTSWLDRESKLVTMHWQGKLRGIPFDPIKLETVVIKPQYLLDAEGNQMPATVIRPVGEVRESELTERANENEIKVLGAIDKSPSSTVRELAMVTGISKSTVQDTISELKKKKWIRSYTGKFKVLGEGKTALKLHGVL